MNDWNRKTWRLAAPLILANISVPLLGAVDTAVVGHLPGAENLGAVAVAAMIFSVVFAGFNFLRMGTTGLTAQAYGAGDAEEIRAWFSRPVVFALLIGLLLVLLQVPVGYLSFLAVSPSEVVLPLAEEYFFIRIWSAPAALANFAMLGWFFGTQNVRAALITQIAMNGINILLDLWFVIGLGLGVAGVAWATLISEVSAVGLGLIYVRAAAAGMGGSWRFRPLLNILRIKRMLTVSRDIFLRSLFLQAGFLTFTIVGARSGDLILAANAVLMNFLLFSAYALDAFAHAAEALAGAEYGARKRTSFRAAVISTLQWASVFSAVFTLFFFVVGGTLIDVLTNIPEVREAARLYMPWAALSPIISVWCFQLDGVFIGATRTREMRDGMVASFLLYVGALLVLVPALGNHGLWLGFLFFMVVRAVTLGLWYPRIERSLEGG